MYWLQFYKFSENVRSADTYIFEWQVYTLIFVSVCGWKMNYDCRNHECQKMWLNDGQWIALSAGDLAKVVTVGSNPGRDRVKGRYSVHLCRLAIVCLAFSVCAQHAGKSSCTSC